MKKSVQSEQSKSTAEELGKFLFQAMEQIDFAINEAFDSGRSHSWERISSKNPQEIAEILPLLKNHYEGRSHYGYLVTFEEIEVVTSTSKGYARANNLPFDEKRDKNNLLFIEERLRCIIKIEDSDRWFKKIRPINKYSTDKIIREAL